jgi:hypothetical protein
MARRPVATSSDSGREFRFRPRSDYQYEVEYIHKKKAYGKSLTQTNTRTGEATQMRVEDWDACKK